MKTLISQRRFHATMLAVLVLAGMTAATPSAPVWAAKKSGSAASAQLSESAQELYNKGVELFQIAQNQADRGNQRGQKALLQEAIGRFEAALQKDMKMVEARSNIGFAYLTMQDYKKAIRAFNEALVLNPRHLNTLNGLSTAYAFQGDIDQAIVTFGRLTTLDPNNSQYYFNKGSVLQKAGRLGEARQAYDEALRINPKDQRVLFNLGTLLENQGQLEQARPFYERAKDIEVSNMIGLEALNRLKAIDEASKASSP